MKKIIKVMTADGQTVRVMLESWGGGMDRLHRHWTLQPDGWYCVDTGKFAQSEDSLAFGAMRLLDARHR